MGESQPISITGYIPRLFGPRRSVQPVAQQLERRPPKRWVGPAVRLAVSVALVGWVCRRIDAADFAQQFLAQSPSWLLAAALVVLVQIGMAALRWRQILAGLDVEVPAGTVLSVTYIASFFNCWLLGTVGGDAARAMLAPAQEQGRTAIVHSVVLDRVLALAGMGLGILPLVVLDLGPFARSLPLLTSLVASAIPLVGLAAIAPAISLVGARRIPFSGLLLGLAESWWLLCRAWRRLGAALVFAALGGVAMSATAWCLGRAEHLDATFVDFLILMPPVLLLAALPISIGGWGVRENAMVSALASVGVGASAAMVLSVQMGALASVVSLPAGGLWLWRALSASRYQRKDATELPFPQERS
jgi:glycosyltransferase 2 family protein